MLSGPRRAQAGSHLPTASARDQRSGSASELTGPRGDVASHFVGQLVLCSEGFLLCKTSWPARSGSSLRSDTGVW